jgi:hypothetical protein
MTSAVTVANWQEAQASQCRLERWTCCSVHTFFFRRALVRGRSKRRGNAQVNTSVTTAARPHALTVTAKVPDGTVPFPSAR